MFSDKVNEALPKSLTKDLEVVLSQLFLTVAKLPSESKCYLNRAVRVSKPTDSPFLAATKEAFIRETFWDIHSSFTSIYLMKAWRTEQLARAFFWALNDWNLSSAAPITRALLETAVSFSFESEQLMSEWKKVKSADIASLEVALEKRRLLHLASVQLLWGTRNSDNLKRKFGNIQIERTNILTLIKKADSRWPAEEIFRNYEILCDAVHPSWGSNECFWREVGYNPDLEQTRILLDKKAVGKIGAQPVAGVLPGSDLPRVFCIMSLWAIKRLCEALAEFERMCVDICLTCRIYTIPELDYYGICFPKAAEAPCVCGSGIQTSKCMHMFGA